MAFVRTPRQRWVEQGMAALATGGPDAVRIEVLARDLGVTKGGFYGHFADRQALLDEVLDTWERSSVDDVITRIEAEGGDGRTRLRRLFRVASTDARDLHRIDLAVRQWARRDRDVASRLRAVDNRRMAYLRTLFATFCVDEPEVEARCTVAMALFISSHLLATDHGHRTRGQAIDLAMDRLLA
ncbi:MAG TPA: TetR/AcrR family transcriptional regulator [Euzebyales bacterium]|nr:TetR/AcrR family transcriptional regulator [Euzebyales bacterium]